MESLRNTQSFDQRGKGSSTVGANRYLSPIVYFSHTLHFLMGVVFPEVYQAENFATL